MFNASRRAALEVLESRRLLASYYVSPSGLDSNDGSLANPFASIARLNTLDLNPGDGVYFEGGQTFAGTFALTQEDLGTAAQPITISSYGTGRATINAGNNNGIFAQNTAGFSISNLAFVGSGLNPLQNNPSGIHFFMNLGGNIKKDFIRIDNVDSSGFWEAGIQIEQNNNSSGFNDVQITNSVVHDIGNQGIQFYGGNYDATTNVLIRNCTAYNVRGNSSLSHNSGNGIVLGSVKNAVVEHCVAYHNGTSGWGGVGIWCWNSDNITIQYCESYDNHTTRDTDGGGFDLDGGTTNSFMQYNYSHDNDGSGYGLFQYRGARAWGNNTVRYNISENDGRKNNAAGLSFWTANNSFNGVDVYNNTVYMDASNLAPSATPQALFFISTKLNNVRLRNNIFMTRNGLELADFVPRQASTLVMQGNDYFSDGQPFVIRWNKKNYTSLSAWQAASGLEKLNNANVGLTLDPKFVNPGGGTIGNADAYRLQANSPLINAGLNLISMGISPGTQDFFGNALPTNTSQQFDVGANEAVI